MTKVTYVNRKVEGIRLGLIVAKDVKKKAKPPSKSDPSHRVSLEIHLEGKKLTDDGLAEAISGMVDAITVAGNDHLPAKLQSLNLAGNDLTVFGLAGLAPVLKASSGDIEELNLSENRLVVSTDKEARQWETYLRSLLYCVKLKTLNLSGNDFGGARAMEILDRIYTSQFAHNDHLWLYSAGLARASTPVHADDAEYADTAEGHNKSVENLSEVVVSGLPSIRNIDVENTSLTNAGALFLSHLLMKHRYVQDTTGASPGSPLGIVFLPNESLSLVSIKLLKLSTTVQSDPLVEDMGADIVGRKRYSVSSASPEPQRARGVYHRRGDSVESGNTASSAKKAVHNLSPPEEVQSLRRKVQRSVLDDSGVHSVQLWSTALKLLAVARCLLAQHDRPPKQTQPKLSIPGGQLMDRGAGSVAPLDPLPELPHSRGEEWLSNLDLSKTTVFEEVPSSHRPGFTTPPHSNRESSADEHPAGTELVLNDLMWPPIELPEPEPIFAGRLPRRPWELILSFLTDHGGVLSDQQVNRIIDWAADKSTLAREIENVGKDRSVQIWWVLDRMGCLAYGETMQGPISLL